MKKVYYFLLIVFFIFPNYSFSGEIVDRILAIVEDEVILMSEVEMLAQMYAYQLKVDPRVDPERFSQIRQESLNQLIEQYVLLAKAIEDSVEISEDEVNMVLDQQINEMIKQAGSQEELEKKLGLPIRKVKNLYRDDVRKKGLIDRYKQQLQEKVKITGEELEEFFTTFKDSLPEVPDNYLISQILKIKIPGDDSKNAAMEKAQMILQKLKEGADFFEMAEQYSDDEVTSSQGGLLGFMKRGDLLKSFEDAAFSLELGEISDVIETPIGFHIMQVIEKKEDTVNLQHILIKTAENNDDESRTVEFLKELKKRAEDDELFDELAKEFSDDPEAKNTGGNIGWIYIEGIQEEIEPFKKVLPVLKVGEISEPFKTQFGYIIVKLEDKADLLVKTSAKLKKVFGKKK